MYKINKNFVVKNIEDGLLLIDMTENKNIFQFNYVGKIILDNLLMTKEDTVEMLAKIYKINKIDISKDYDLFINDLLKNGIIEVDNEK